MHLNNVNIQHFKTYCPNVTDTFHIREDIRSEPQLQQEARGKAKMIRNYFISLTI